MSLDGLRAWIGEVERKLRMRTRVFLALAVIAIGAAGAAIYLAIDTRSDAVSEGDVRELQEKLEARIGGGGEGDVAQLEAELKALQAEVVRLQSQGGSPGQGGGSNQGSSQGGGSNQGGGSSGGGSSSGGGAGSSGDGGAGGGANPGASSDSADGARLKELLEKTKKQAEEAEGK